MGSYNNTLIGYYKVTLDRFKGLKKWHNSKYLIRRWKLTYRRGKLKYLGIYKFYTVEKVIIHHNRHSKHFILGLKT